LDPAQVVGLGFSFGAESEPVEGILWVDELSLVTNEIELPPQEEEEISPPEPTSEPTPPPADPTEPTQPTEAAVVVEPTTPGESPEVPAEAVEAPAEEEAGGGLCPLATIMLPLVLAAVVLGRRVR
jgi:hypothetical protein